MNARNGIHSESCVGSDADAYSYTTKQRALVTKGLGSPSAARAVSYAVRTRMLIADGSAARAVADFI